MMRTQTFWGWWVVWWTETFFSDSPLASEDTFLAVTYTLQTQMGAPRNCVIMGPIDFRCY